MTRINKVDRTAVCPSCRRHFVITQAEIDQAKELWREAYGEEITDKEALNGIEYCVPCVS